MDIPNAAETLAQTKALVASAPRASGSATGFAMRRVGSPAQHRQKHRGLDRDGSITFKQQSVSQLELNIQRGIRAIVEYARIESRQSTSKEDVLTPADCNQVYRVRIPADEEVHGDFTSKSHAPRAFRYVRKVLRVNDEDFVDSICDHPLVMLKTPGKSGAVFFRSTDGRYLLKTVSKGESKFFLSVLYDYAQHVREMTQEHKLRTLLPHFYELIHIDTPAGRNIRLVIMNNLTPLNIGIHESFDFKGSWVGRWTREEEAGKAGVTLKDLDATHALQCSTADRELVADQLRLDSAWLEAHGVIDYSLLCLHHYPARPVSRDGSGGFAPASSAPSIGVEQPCCSSGGGGSGIRGVSQSIRATSASEQVVVHYGIIDIMQSWRLFKRAEHLIKAIRYPTQSAGVSVTDPHSYARRFREKLIARFESSDRPPPQAQSTDAAPEIEFLTV